jgi:hypothetical protein
VLALRPLITNIAQKPELARHTDDEKGGIENNEENKGRVNFRDPFFLGLIFDSKAQRIFKDTKNL